MYYVYILKSKLEDWYYVGYTANLEERLVRHNKGLVHSTNKRKPFEVVYVEEFDSQFDAINREREIKDKRRLKEGIINSLKVSGPIV